MLIIRKLLFIILNWTKSFCYYWNKHFERLTSIQCIPFNKKTCSSGEVQLIEGCAHSSGEDLKILEICNLLYLSKWYKSLLIDGNNGKLIIIGNSNEIEILREISSRQRSAQDSSISSCTKQNKTDTRPKNHLSSRPPTRYDTITQHSCYSPSQTDRNESPREEGAEQTNKSESRNENN